MFQPDFCNAGKIYLVQISLSDKSFFEATIYPSKYIYNFNYSEVTFIIISIYELNYKSILEKETSIL